MILPWQDNFSRHCFLGAFFFWLVNLFLLFFFWLKLPPQVPLFYSRPWGEEQLATPAFLFLLPAGTAFILLANLLLTHFWAEEKLILRTLSLTSSLCAFLSLFALIKILNLSL